MATRGVRLLLWTGMGLVGLLAIAIFSAPLWLRPLIERGATQHFAHPIEIGSAHIAAVAPLTLIFDEIVIGNPPGIAAAEPPFAHIARMTVTLNVFNSLRSRDLVITALDLQQPILRAVSTADGAKNYVFPAAHAQTDALRITGGQAHVTLAGLQADFQVSFETQPAPDQPGSTQLTADAQGTYAALPATAHLTGGTSVRSDPGAQPWPLSLQVTDGQTKLSADGTLLDPIRPSNAQLKLQISGPDAALLKPLIGVTLPFTPPFSVEGSVIYRPGVFDITGTTGRVGHSDLGGTVTAQIGGGNPPDTIADLHSHDATLADLISIVTNGKTPVQGELFSRNPLHVPQLGGGAVHLTYAAERVEEKSATLDNLSLHLEMTPGALTLHPLSVAIGPGRLTGDLTLTPRSDGATQATSDIRLDNIDLARLTQGTPYRDARGLDGTLQLTGAGPSIAAIMAAANGHATFWMQGGDMSALVADLAGLRLGSALLAWLTGQHATHVDCFVADLPLQRGILSSRSLLLETANALTEGHGILNLAQEAIDLRLRTQSKHLTVGVLAGPLRISGRLTNPTAAPEPTATGILSDLPGVQFGIGETSQCEGELNRVRGAQGSTRTKTP